MFFFFANFCDFSIMGGEVSSLRLNSDGAVVSSSITTSPTQSPSMVLLNIGKMDAIIFRQKDIFFLQKKKRSGEVYREGGRGKG